MNLLRVSLGITLCMGVFTFQAVAAEIPRECSEFQTPLGLDAGRASRLLRSEDWRTRSLGVRCLSHSEQASTLLLGVATDKDARVKRTALFSLGEKGLSSPLYVRLLQDSDPVVRTLAAEYAHLSGIEAIDPLVERAKNASGRVEERLLALKSLSRFGRAASPSRAHIFQLLNDPNESIRIGALRIVAAFGTSTPDAVPHLERRLVTVARGTQEYAWVEEALVRVEPSTLAAAGQ